MKLVYASRTGNVASIIERLNMDAIEITNEVVVEEEYVLFTYTDGFGDIPYEVETFLSHKSNAKNIKGVIVSGDSSYGEAYCLAGEKISEQYNVACLYKVENEGEQEDIDKILAILKKL